MIHYDNESWWSLVFRYHSTVWESIWLPLVCIVSCLLAAYCLELYYDARIGSEGHTIFGSTMSYLMVFRAHSASQRYWHGRGCLTRVFVALREFVTLMCVTTKGGSAGEAWREKRAPKLERTKCEDGDDIRASMARVNCVRWAIAFVVSLKIHARICRIVCVFGWIPSEEKQLLDMDRIRLRALTTRQEFEELNDLIPIIGEQHVTRGALTLTPKLIEEILEPLEGVAAYEVDSTPDLRQPLGVLIRMRLEITRHMNEPYGFKERFAKDFLHIFSEVALVYESITTVISTPIPFPYVHLCRLLLIIFLASMPLVIDTDHGLFENVVLPSCVAMSLLGIDAISTELENPFGDDTNDHDMVGAVSKLEAECIQILELCGDIRARDAFTSCRFPEALQVSGQNAAREFLCLSSQVRGDAAVSAPPSSPCTRDPAPGRPRSKSKDRRASFEIPEVDGGGDPQRPLLGSGPEGLASGPSANSQLGFHPMREFGTETLVLEEERQGAGAAAGPDHVGLSDEEDGPSTQRSSVDMQQVAAGDDDIKASAQGFRPMDEMASQTMVFEGPLADDEVGLDVVGLSEDEEADQDSRRAK